MYNVSTYSNSARGRVVAFDHMCVCVQDRVMHARARKFRTDEVSSVGHSYCGRRVAFYGNIAFPDKSYREQLYHCMLYCDTDFNYIVILNLKRRDFKNGSGS